MAYLDDILIYLEKTDEHIQHVKTVLRKLREKHLKIKPKKSCFHVQRVEFLEHVVTLGKLEMDLVKVKAIIDWPTPKNVKEVQSFLELVNYYRKFILNYSKEAKELLNIAKKEKEWR